SICHEGVTKHHFSIYLPLSDRFNSLITKYYFVSVNLQLSDYFFNQFKNCSYMIHPEFWNNLK
ncbi:hypothetical protein, partial [Flectobacillus longus]|uniref:hypothetical protein n=1 Tax=Flectobacillus longus TaxID=2984207 RepID=UPI0024B664C8